MPSIIGYQSVTVQPKLWKNGRHASTASPLPRFSMIENCEHVAEQVAMAEDDPLRLAAGAAGEKDHRFIAIAGARQFQKRGDGPGRQHRDGGAPGKNGGLQLGHHLLEMDHVLRPGELGEALHERARRNAIADAADAHRGFERGFAGGEVEVHRRLAGERHGEIRDDRGFAGRQHDRHARGLAILAHMPGKRRAGGQEHAARERAAIHPVDRGGVELAAFQPAHTGAREMIFQLGALLIAMLAQL